MSEKIRLLAVVGPTASGKTSLAVELARALDGEVVSCDSMQIYRGMTIATAAPTAEEQQGVPHHLIEMIQPTRSFSVVEYVSMAREAIADIAARGKTPVLCGGTGLYYSSLTDGIEFSEAAEDAALRQELQRRAVQEGGEALLAELAQFDPQSAERLAPADHKRIIRAIEVYRTTGRTMTEHIARSRTAPRPYDTTAIGLFYHDRQRLYDRIDRRVDIMLENGLLEETRRFFAADHAGTAVQAIGYKELRPYLDGLCSLEEATENLKRATRRYAKRQISWFGRDDRIARLYMDDENDKRAAVHRALELMNGMDKEKHHGTEQ